MKRRKKRAIQLALQGTPAQQVGALPYRMGPDGKLQLLLITSRETRRFVVPKGWPMKKKSRAAAAALEAKQEAGVVGEYGSQPIGCYRYWKRLPHGFVPIDVSVFALHVDRELREWKERRERHRKWLSPDEAALLVDEPQLVSLVQQASAILG